MENYDYKYNEDLPFACYAVLPTTNEVIIIKNGECGYYRTGVVTDSRKFAEEIAEKQNELLHVTKDQQQKMFRCSMFGWHCPEMK